MKLSLLQYLACPDCKGVLKVSGQSRMEHSELKEGVLKCQGCSRVYPVTNFIPRFVHTDGYVNTFSYEWRKHAKTQLDSFSGTLESEETFCKKTGFGLKDLQGKLVLDVGCGAGRFSEVVHKQGGVVIGIDYSYAIDAAFENLGLRPDVHFIQADVFRLPLRKEFFDYVFSIGVLHHTPNTKSAFKQLPCLLKTGGEIAIWVYSDEGLRMKIHNRISDLLRSVTLRMPSSLLYVASHIAVPLYYLKKLKFIGVLFYILPTSTHSNSTWRVLDTFDWYSPQYQWKHTFKEVISWFQEEGLREIVSCEIPVAVKAKKQS